MKAKIFNIQRFSIHDGPGIRTTIFFKGCPLKCLWCHNPESMNMQKDILYDVEKCTSCGQCISKCPNSALSFIDNKIMTDIQKCYFCGNCDYYCVNGAREIVGQDYTIEEVIKEARKDIAFFEESNGGITLSGGEPLLQIEFVEELLKKLKKIGLHTAVDTSGYVPFENIERIVNYTDLFLYDIKSIDDDKHLKYTGVSNKLILENLKKISEIHNNINLRLPIIEGINADINEIKKVNSFINSLNIRDITILPYHDIAKHKYKKLGKMYNEELMRVPSEEKIKKIEDILKR